MSRETDAKDPRVSVVMPVRNVEAYVEQALHSLLEQSMHDIEILVVDDRSCDGTVEKVSRSTDRRVRIIPGEGRGVSAARNRGLAAARGRYVAMMDGDDSCSRDRLDRQVAFLEENPDVAAVGTSYCAIDEEGDEITVVPHLSSADEVEAAMYSFNPMCGASLVARREALNGIGGYDETLSLGEDYDLCARLLVQGWGRLANLVDPLYHYRWHRESTSARRRVQLDQGLSAVREELWSHRPPARPSLSQLVRRDVPRSGVIGLERKRRRLRASAYLQLGLQMLRRGRILDGVVVVVANGVAHPESMLGSVGHRLERLRGQTRGEREYVRQVTAHLLRFLVRHVPPRRRGARLVAAVNRVVPAPRTTVKTRIAPGVTLSCNVRDSVGWRIFYRGEFEPALTRLLIDELRPGETFLDVGANCGYYTLLAAREVGTHGRVHAFEPSRDIVTRLRRDIARNGFEDRVRVHNVAVGAARGSAVLEPGADPTSAEGTRHLAISAQPEDSPDSVDVIAVDDVLAGRPIDVVKIDIEGYEEQALLGMKELLAAARPKLVVVEAVDAHLARFGSSVGQLVDLMRTVGYEHSMLREPGFDDILVFRPGNPG